MVKRADESMTTGRDDGGTRDDESEAIRGDIERTRGDMSRTVNEIEERLSPAHIKEQVQNVTSDLEHKVGSRVASELRDAKSAVRDATVGRVQHMVSDARESVSGAGSSVLDTVRANPIPAALIGLGLGWMLVSARRSRGASPMSDRGRSMRRYRAGAGDRYGYRSGYGMSEGREERDYGRGSRRGGRRGIAGAMRAATEETSHLGERAQETAREVGDKVSHLTGDARERGRRIAHDARSQMMRAERTVESSFRDNPLAASAVALAIGAAIGLSLPHTSVEDEWVGEAKERLLRRAQSAAGEAIQGAEHAASRLVGSQQEGQQGQQGAQSQQPEQGQQQGQQEPSPDTKNGIGGGRPSSRSV